MVHGRLEQVLVPVVVVDLHMAENLLNPTGLQVLGDLDVVHQDHATVVFIEGSDIPGSVINGRLGS